MSLRNKFATALLATTALVASNAQAGKTITNEDEVRALTASCEQAVIWYGDKIPHPEHTIERFAQGSAKNRDVTITTIAGNPDGIADVYVCSGKSNKDYTSLIGADAIQDAASYQDVAQGGLTGKYNLHRFINNLNKKGEFDGAKIPEERAASIAQNQDNLIAQTAPKL